MGVGEEWNFKEGDLQSYFYVCLLRAKDLCVILIVLDNIESRLTVH